MNLIRWTCPPLLAACAAATTEVDGPRPEPALSPASPSIEQARVERRVGLMGTLFAESVEAADRPAALEASEAAVRALEEVEARLSTWREDSELARLNGHPVGEPFEASAALHADLVAARRAWEATGGAFDPAVAALVQAWGLREGGREPSADELRRALDRVGFAALHFGAGRELVRAREIAIEEGGFGKGIGLDAAGRALAARGASGVLDLGGQVLLVDRGAERFELAHPDDRQRPVVSLAIDAGSFATSGNSERGIVVGGRALGHLLDPASGRPVEDFGSLTVWAPDATSADCLSTGLYVMGPDAALAWARAAEGVEVLVAERTPSGLHLRATSGWQGRLEVLDPSVRLTIEGPEGKGP